MQYTTDMKRDMGKKVSFMKQAGVSSLLFIVLVGLSLTVLTVGYMSSMRNLQSSATTTHAQTQAQIQAMIGYHALTKYLDKLRMEVGGLEKIEKIEKIKTGTISDDIKFTMFKCGDQYCFDITGKSGGASAILRAQYGMANELSNEQLKGSIFEGGLKVNTLANLTASDVTLEIGGGEIVDMGNNATPYTADQLKQAGIKVIPYKQRDFISSEEARKYANYIFYEDGGILKCARNNYYDSVSKTEIKTETLAGSIAACSVAITKNGTNPWVIDSSKSLPAGVLWFDSNVLINLHASKIKEKNKAEELKDTNILVNTIISNGNIDSSIVELNGNYDATYFDAFAPHHYVLNAPSAEKSARLLKVCPDNYPIQYCKAKGELKAEIDMKVFPASISNILYLSKTLQLIGGKDQKNVNVNYYGNIMANSAAGGTGSSSGKLVGTGTVKISGNLMVVGSTDMTAMTGDFKLNLSKADDPGNFVPVYKKEFNVGGIRYM